MRFVHAADLHLDSPMRGLSRYEGAPADELRGASRRALGEMVRTTLDVGAELVVLAGDVFDGDWTDYNTGLFFTSQVAALTREGVKVVVLAGNHDAAGQLTRNLDLPQGAFRLSHDAAQTIGPELLGLDVAVHGQSYATRDVGDNLARGYPAAVPGVLNIGLLHTALAGRPGHEPYAPCSLDDLRAKGYDYWALGHIHQREVVTTDPWVVFAGNLQGRHARETGPKGFTLVTAEDGRIATVDHHDADVVRWFRCVVDAAGATRAGSIVDLVHAELTRAIDDADGRLVAARVVVEGATSAHDELHNERESFEAEVRNSTYDLGDIWVEKVELATSRELDLTMLRDRDDAIGELLGSMTGLRGDPDRLAERYAERFEKLRAKLPAAVLAEGIDPSSPEVLLRALDAAESRVAALLHEGDPS